MNKNMYHGNVLYRLMSESPISIKTDKMSGAYIVNEESALMVKYSSKRLSPWNFTINNDFNDSIIKLSDEYSVFVVLVCHDDGICCLSYDEYIDITNFNSFETNSISAKRRKGESYTVSGTEDIIKGKIKDSHFPTKIFNVL